MTIDQGLFARASRQLRRDEGAVSHAYADSEGYLTIGVGRLVDKRKGGRLRDDEMEYLLRNDIEETAAALRDRLPWFTGLDEARQGVLLNMAFNLGVSGLLGFRQTLALVERGDYQKAAEEMLNSKWARQVGSRANRLAEQMETGRWQ